MEDADKTVKQICRAIKQIAAIKRLSVELRNIAGDKELQTVCDSRLSVSLWNTINDFETEVQNLIDQLDDIQQQKSNEI